MDNNLTLGWAFPPEFTLDKGVTMTASLEEDVNQSLSILFQTLSGERVMFDTYGSDLHSRLFANIDSVLISDMEAMIYESVLRYERRVEIIDISVQPDSGSASKLNVLLQYRLSNSELVHQWQASMDMFDGQGLLE
ncbi:phage baseplate assembly protein W [Shewanella psychrophila]|uniref:Phage baseplate assembly protein W n=1 Tax=Shewanella psychrophila TaxID=225848 RepID=A0A1S6HM98_9GAMM|nr:GPW/gp25 family protein [Shewanella psychrophila]AQS36640.1 phage baseplate assembly protein W [Shewanella psychrophila]